MEFTASNGIKVSRSKGTIKFNYGEFNDGMYIEASEETALREFFEAEREMPKPWRDAIAGEIWALTLEGHVTAWTMSNAGVFGDPDSTLDPNSRMITAGRRIWPESD